MTDIFPKPRTLPEDLEPTRTGRGAGSGGHHDPLAELARLVGREDPFRDFFPGRAEPVRDVAQPGREVRPARLPVPDDFPALRDFEAEAQPEAVTEHDDFFRYDEPHRPTETAEHELSAQAAPSAGLFHAADDRRDSLHFPELARHDSVYNDPHAGQFATADHHDEASELNPDLWAQGMPEPEPTVPVDYEGQFADVADERDGSRRRTLVVLGAVVLLTVGGLGASFLVRGGSSGATASSAVPTIMADSAPTKVQPPETSNAATGGDGTTALLEKSASDNVDNAKVINTQERPIDLAQLPKPATAAPSQDGRAGPPVSGSPFPEPKKVKTIMIRPDGSVVGADAGPAPQSALPSMAADAASPASVGAAATTPPPAGSVAKPSTPKSTARISTTPRSTADGVAAAKPKVVHTPPKPKPVETADATGTPAAAAETTASTAPAGGGGFAVQLAAPASEQEARDVSDRLQKKYGDALDGHKPSIRKADNKSVYRVRVGNLSQDDAKSMCAKVQSGGGSCFVVRN